MAYTIQYDNDSIKVFSRKLTEKKRVGFVLFIFVILITVGLLFSYAADYDLMYFLLPGDPEITGAALSTMIGNLKEGKKLSEAVTIFCLEIIDNATISQ